MQRRSNARHVTRGAQGLNKSEAGCVELDDESKFELDIFCYLGDMLCAKGEQRKLLEQEYGHLGGSLMS